MRSNSTSYNMTTRILPFIVFPLLTAAAAKFFVIDAASSGLADKMATHCGIPLPGYSDFLSDRDFLQPYTGFSRLDNPGICGFVVAFHALLNSPTPIPFIEYFTATGMPYVLFTMVEGYRQGQNILLRYPAFWLLLTQFASYGASYPVYCMLLVATGGVARARRFNSRDFSQAEAESIVFGIIAGGVLPSLAMCMLDNLFVTWTWQFFPILISASQFLYLQIRRPSPHSQSGYSTMRFIYMATFLVAACWHISTVWQRKSELSNLFKFLIPTTTLPNRSSDIGVQIHHLLKWDYSLGYTAASIASLWHAQSIEQLIYILSWYAIATPLLGIGAAFIGVAMWRDSILEGL